jgi:hypothetical protein
LRFIVYNNNNNNNNNTIQCARFVDPADNKGVLQFVPGKNEQTEAEFNEERRRDMNT